jgi:PAS domain S-box-containing protein
MDRVSRHSWFRSARSPGVLLLALIVLLGVGGYLLTSTTIRRDRDEAAERRARAEVVHAEEVLGRAREYVAGLADVLASEPEPGQARFASWAGATSASVGLNDVLWVERVPSSERGRYERLRGVPITRLTASGRLARAPAAGWYLPATFTSQTRPELRPGVDVTGFPALEDAIRDRAGIFAVGASRPGALGRESGFYLLEAASFARGRDGRGYLVAFVPRGWFSTRLGGDPQRLAISEDGQRIEGQLDSVHASAGFEMLGRQWAIDVDREPPSGLQSTLPWLALAWPFAVAGIAFPIGRATTLRRRAQRDVQRIFELSLDMVAVVGFDGRYRAVNPAFERTLGYARQDMLARPFSDFVHPDDLDASRAAFTTLLGGGEVAGFENRFICADGSTRWLQWSARAVPEQHAVYGIARDVTERRRIDAELREAQRTAEAQGAELLVRAAAQAALRRVATLVAREATQPKVFSVIAEEVGQLLGTQEIRILRYEDDDRAVVVGVSGRPDAFPLGSRQELEGDTAASRVRRTERTARIDNYGTASGPLAETARAVGVRSAVGAPVVVEGRLWGAIVAGSTHDEPLPPETESRLGEFTELMATAIANTESRARADRLADEQAALRRVATLVAQAVQPAEIFSAVCDEVGRLFGGQSAVLRFESEGPAVVVVGVGKTLDLTVGTRWELDDSMATAKVYRSGRPARVQAPDWSSLSGQRAEAGERLGVVSTVASPIAVEGRVWGAATVASMDKPLPIDTEQRLEQFTGLIATAIANAESREALGQLAAQQSSLRRVATLVAEGASPSSVLDAVAAEMERVLAADAVTLSRFEHGAEVTVVAHRGSDPRRVPPGTRVSHHGENVTTMVRRAGRSARMEHHDRTYGAIAEISRSVRVRASVGAPIVVDGRLWGVAVATWRGDQSPPADTEKRMAQFTELLDTAIANADSRDRLNASRARLVTEADEARRRVVRDLHDGGQQRLVHTIVTLKLAERALRDSDGEAASLVGEALEQAERGNAELRELAHGILPTALTTGGLRAGVDAVAARLDLPVDVDVPAQRFPAEIERSAYFIVAESLTNIAKHADARHAQVRAVVDDATLHVEIRDDGIGGADPDGHGLIGLRDRATALGGRVDIDSPPGGGTAVTAKLPIRH